MKKKTGERLLRLKSFLAVFSSIYKAIKTYKYKRFENAPKIRWLLYITKQIQNTNVNIKLKKHFQMLACVNCKQNKFKVQKHFQMFARQC